jgi:hypothetical protein
VPGCGGFIARRPERRNRPRPLRPHLPRGSPRTTLFAAAPRASSAGARDPCVRPRRRRFVRENAIHTNACPRRRPQRRRALSLIAAILSFTACAAHAAGLPRISVESGRIEVSRGDIAGLPEVSMIVQRPGPALSAPEIPGRRTVVEATVAGQGTETLGGLQPRLRLGYGKGDGASPVTGYSDVFVRGVLIREFD